MYIIYFRFVICRGKGFKIFVVKVIEYYIVIFKVYYIIFVFFLEIGGYIFVKCKSINGFSGSVTI